MQEEIKQDDRKKPSKEELIEMLEHMIDSYERLPPHAAMIPISHQDYWAGLLLLCEIVKR